MLFPEVRGTAAATPPPAESEEDLDDICKTLLVNACRGNACILKGGGVTEAPSNTERDGCVTEFKFFCRVTDFAVCCKFTTTGSWANRIEIQRRDVW